MRKKHIENLLIDIINQFVSVKNNKELDSKNIFLPLDESGFGLSSLDRLKLLSHIEQKMNVDFPEAYWGSKMFKNLADIIDYLHQSQDFSK